MQKKIANRSQLWKKNKKKNKKKKKEQSNILKSPVKGFKKRERKGVFLFLPVKRTINKLGLQLKSLTFN